MTTLIPAYTARESASKPELDMVGGTGFEPVTSCMSSRLGRAQIQTVSVFQEGDAETVRVLRPAIRTVYALILVQRSGTSCMARSAEPTMSMKRMIATERPGCMSGELLAPQARDPDYGLPRFLHHRLQLRVGISPVLNGPSPPTPVPSYRESPRIAGPTAVGRSGGLGRSEEPADGLSPPAGRGA